MGGLLKRGDEEPEEEKEESKEEEEKDKEKGKEKEMKAAVAKVRFTHKKENKTDFVLLRERGRKVETCELSTAAYYLGNARDMKALALVTSTHGFLRGTISSFKIFCHKSCGKHEQPRCTVGIVKEYNSKAFSFWYNWNKGKKDVFGYYYYGNGKIYRAGGHAGKVFNVEDETRPDRSGQWGTGDVICVTVDCVAWNITFEKNGKKVGKTMRIEENDAYFPALELCTCEGVSFAVLDA